MGQNQYVVLRILKAGVWDEMKATWGAGLREKEGWREYGMGFRKEPFRAKRKLTWENLIISNYPKVLHQHRIKKKKKKPSEYKGKGMEERRDGSFPNLPSI